MDREIYIIDGYNLLKRGCGFGRPGRALAAQRAMLEVVLRDFLRARPGSRAILVYDGAPGAGGGEASSGSGRPDARLEIVYAIPPETADDRIIEESLRRRGPERVAAVTSDDKDIGRRLRGAGVRVIPSEAFAISIEEALDARSGRGRPAAAAEEAGSEKPSAVCGAEASELLRAFSKPKPRSRGRRDR